MAAWEAQVEGMEDLAGVLEVRVTDMARVDRAVETERAVAGTVDSFRRSCQAADSPWTSNQLQHAPEVARAHTRKLSHPQHQRRRIRGRGPLKRTPE